MIPSVLLAGFGRMGSAMAAGWREMGLAPSVAVDPARPASPGPELAVAGSLAEIPAGFTPRAVILAVKPQMAATALPPLAPYCKGAVVLSIMAGRTIAGIRGMLGDVPVVRAMPNTPAAIRQGMTVACAGPGVSGEARALCTALLEAIGTVAWVEDEALLDPVTAVSGSGPAYVFLLAEEMEKAAVEQGIPPDLARLLARRTVAGAGALLAASEEDAAALRVAVTSPAGTTAAALAVLMAEWPGAVSRAIAVATRRSRELAG